MVLILYQQVLSRGRIVQADKKTGQWENFETLSIPIKREMVPSARIVVFFIKNNFVAGDSLWIDVEDKCQKEVNAALLCYKTCIGCILTFISFNAKIWMSHANTGLSRTVSNVKWESTFSIRAFYIVIVNKY